MDTLHAMDGTEDAEDAVMAAEPQPEPPPPAIGGDERRMHVRAYNYWASLLDGRAFPSIADLDPASIGDFGPNSVLLDFTGGRDDPAIPWLGRALREEGDHRQPIRCLSDVPGRSLLSRLTDHYLEVVANRAPIGFEAEFVNAHGRNALYRGILMPFSSDGGTIDFIYGVINWKEMADAALVAGIEAEMAHAAAQSAQVARPSHAGPAQVAAPAAAWADGPSRPGSQAAPAADEDGLGDRLAIARDGADAVRAADTRSRGALYRALGLAYDFALAAQLPTVADDYAELLQDAGIRLQARAPMTAIVKLVFGADYDKARLTEFAAALCWGRRLDVPAGGLRPLLERREGGLKAIVADERAARRPAARPDPTDAARAALRARAALATLTLADGGADEFVLLIARRDGGDRLSVVGVADDSPLLDRAIRGIGQEMSVMTGSHDRI